MSVHHFPRPSDLIPLPRRVRVTDFSLFSRGVIPGDEFEIEPASQGSLEEPLLFRLGRCFLLGFASQLTESLPVVGRAVSLKRKL